jgi:acyl-CoA reductase-like NAD-dependent aldehyde dehydrogenase
MKVGNGLDAATQMGPVITHASQERVIFADWQGRERRGADDRGRALA